MVYLYDSTCPFACWVVMVPTSVFSWGGAPTKASMLGAWWRVLPSPRWRWHRRGRLVTADSGVWNYDLSTEHGFQGCCSQICTAVRCGSPGSSPRIFSRLHTEYHLQLGFNRLCWVDPDYHFRCKHRWWILGLTPLLTFDTWNRGILHCEPWTHKPWLFIGRVSSDICMFYKLLSKLAPMIWKTW